MTTALVERVRETKVLPERWNGEAWVSALRETVWKDLSDAEFMVCAAFAGQHELNPFRNEMFVIQGRPFVGRDGFIARAERHPRYESHRAGQVYENDVFHIDEDDIAHRTTATFDRGRYLGAYVTIWTTDGLARTFTGKPQDFKHLHNKPNWQRDLEGMVLIRTICQAFRSTLSLGNFYTTDEAPEVLEGHVVELSEGRLSELTAALAGGDEGEVASADEQVPPDTGESPSPRSIEVPTNRREALKQEFERECKRRGLNHDMALDALMRSIRVDDARRLTIEAYETALDDMDSLEALVRGPGLPMGDAA